MRRWLERAATAAGLTLLVGGCAAMQARCAAGETAAVSEWLYFGTARPGGAVSPQEWSGFLASVVTSRFPAGLTAWPAAGQWRSADGSITKEDSFVLNLVHPGDAAAEQGVISVVAEYKTRFIQEAVLRVRSPVCTSP